LYVEIRKGEDFDKFTMPAMASGPDIPLPKSGGCSEHGARVVIHSGETLIALGYHGDVEAWRGRYLAYCIATDRKWGIAKGGRLLLSDGSEYALTDQTVELY